MTSLLQTLMSPLSGGTELCKGVTTSVLHGWQSNGLNKVNIGIGEGMSVPKMLKA